MPTNMKSKFIHTMDAKVENQIYVSMNTTSKKPWNLRGVDPCWRPLFVVEWQGQGLLHIHDLNWNPDELYDPRLDMHIHYDPVPDPRYMVYVFICQVYKCQGMSMIHQPVQRFVCEYTTCLSPIYN